LPGKQVTATNPFHFISFAVVFMASKGSSTHSRAVQAGGSLSFFERYLTLWVFLCIGAGILLGRLFPGVAVALDAMSLYQVSIPIAICLFFMMYPIMVKIDFSQAAQAVRTPKPVILTLVGNWLIKPFTMVVFAQFFLGWLFRPLIVGTEVIRGVEVSLTNSYIAGTILLGIAPCTAMVLLWGYLCYTYQRRTLHPASGRCWGDRLGFS
jgi:ACR3 family arsenite transporter